MKHFALALVESAKAAGLETDFLDWKTGADLTGDPHPYCLDVPAIQTVRATHGREQTWGVAIIVRDKDVTNLIADGGPCDRLTEFLASLIRTEMDGRWWIKDVVIGVPRPAFNDEWFYFVYETEMNITDKTL